MSRGALLSRTCQAGPPAREARLDRGPLPKRIPQAGRPVEAENPAGAPGCGGRAAPSVSLRPRPWEVHCAEQAGAVGPMRQQSTAGALVVWRKVTNWSHDLVENDTNAYLQRYGGAGRADPDQAADIVRRRR